jgi:hypothetical protein
MDVRVRRLLVDRCKQGAPPVTAREIVRLLGVPQSSKSAAKTEVNRLLYNTDKALPSADNPLGLPAQYRLTKYGTAAPQWSVSPTCSQKILADRGALAAWHAYAMLCAAPNTPVDVMDLLGYPHAPTRDALLTKMRDHILAVNEPVEPVGDTCVMLRIVVPPADDTVELDCDAIVGQNRDHVRCVLLGMAIIDSVIANRPKQVVLTSRNPGTLAVLRNVIKTDEGARSLNIAIEDTSAPTNA